MNANNTIATEISRANLVAIANRLNIENNLGIERVSRLSTPALVRLFARHEQQAIEIGASLDVDQCFAAYEPEVTTVTKPGVINTIINIVRSMNGKSFTVQDVHHELVKAFPDRNEHAMMRTVRTQVPTRMTTDSGFKFERNGHSLRVVHAGM